MLIDRRHFLRITANTIASATACCFATPGRTAAPSACMLSEAKFQKVAFLGGVPDGTPAVRSFQGTILGGSGDASFDAALGRHVLSPLANEFQVNPGFGYHQEKQHLEHGDENALASTFTRVSRTQGTVVLGLNLLQRFLAVPGGDFAVMAICAHEFAHIKQFDGEYAAKISQTLPGYCIELHADFLAGYFVRIFSESLGVG